MSDEIHIRPLEMGDMNSLHLLFARNYGSPRPLAYETWRMFKTPYGVIPGVVAVGREKIVASYTAWPVLLDIGGEILKGAQSMDTLTDADYRGRGLFVKLAMRCMEMMAGRGYEVLYGFPNTNSFHGFVHRLNWDNTGDAPMWKRLITPGASLPAPLSAAARLAWGLINRRGSVHGLDIAESPNAPPDLDAILAKWRDAESRSICRIHRERNWLDWRYDPASGLGYVWVSVRRNGRLIAALVYRVDRGRAVIAETLGERDGLVGGIGHLVSNATNNGWISLATLTTDPNTIDALDRNGFVRRGHQRLIVKKLATRELRANIHHHDGWRLFGGDFDVY